MKIIKTSVLLFVLVSVIALLGVFLEATEIGQTILAFLQSIFK